MKVLIITYYWPPAGGSGVQRWLKFVKYLQNFDVEPIVYTVDNANYPKEDKTLLQEVPTNIKILKQPISHKAPLQPHIGVPIHYCDWRLRYVLPGAEVLDEAFLS